MRLLSARLSAKRRSPIAGVRRAAARAPGDRRRSTPLLSPAQARTKPPSSRRHRQGRALFLVGCASCHGQNGEGVVTERGTQYGPSLAGVGAAAVDFQVGTGRMPMAQPGCPGAGEGGPLQRRARSASSRRSSPRWAPVRPSRRRCYDPNAIPEDEREEAVVRGGEFFRTNCTACHNFAATGGALPDGKYAPSLVGVSRKHIYEAMLTGPQQMPVFSDAILTPEEKREIIAYLESIEDSPSYGGSTWARSARSARACSPGWSASAPASASPALDRLAQCHVRPRRGSPGVSDDTRSQNGSGDDAPAPREPSRSPTPACTSTCRGRPTSTRAPRSAPSARSPPSSVCPAVCAILFCVAYFAFDIGGSDPDMILGSAPPTSPSA